MTTNQPVWKQVGTVGDVNPFDYDGGFVYEDETGVYSAELEWIEAQDDGSGEAGPWKVYRWDLDRLETVEIDGAVYLVPFGFGARTDLPYSIESYDEWFHRDLGEVADTVGSTVEELRAALCSEDPMRRAFAYLELAQYHGFENFDSYPLEFSKEKREELEARYARV